MKSLLFVMLTICMFSCSKENAGTSESTGTATHTVRLVTGVYIYLNTSIIDTARDYSRYDSIYYNADLQIEKVVCKWQTGILDTYRFAYRSDGNIDSVKMTADAGNTDFFFHYNSNDKLDSIERVEYPYGERIAYIFSYDENGYVQHLNSIFRKSAYVQGKPFVNITYYRNSAGGMDSIYTELFNNSWGDPTIGTATMADFSGTEKLDKNAINKAYMFMLAGQYSPYFAYMKVNYYWHQFINPDISLLKNGTYDITNTYLNKYYPYHTFSFDTIQNPDQSIRFLIESESERNNSYSFEVNKLIYGDVPTMGDVYN